MLLLGSHLSAALANKLSFCVPYHLILNNGDISVVFAHFNTTQTISMYSGDPGATPPGGYLGEMSSAMFNSNPNTVHTSSTGYFQFALSQYSGDLPTVDDNPIGFEFFWVVQQYCTLCQALKYANAADATESLLCNARNYATVGDARGFGHTRCELCVVGTYKDTSMDSCKQCPENHLSDAGAISIDGCIQCELWTLNVSSKTCVLCPTCHYNANIVA